MYTELSMTAQNSWRNFRVRKTAFTHSLTHPLPFLLMGKGTVLATHTVKDIRVAREGSGTLDRSYVDGLYVLGSIEIAFVPSDKTTTFLGVTLGL